MQHYFRTVFRAAGLKWDEDNDAEIHILVEGVAAACAPAAPTPPTPVVVRKNGRAYSLPDQSAKNREDVKRMHAEGMSDTEIAAAMPHLARSTVKELRAALGLAPNVKKFAGHPCCGAKGQRHKKECDPQGADEGTLSASEAKLATDKAWPPKDAGCSWKCTECGSTRRAEDCVKPEKCSCGNTALVQVT